MAPRKRRFSSAATRGLSRRDLKAGLRTERKRKAGLRIQPRREALAPIKGGGAVADTASRPVPSVLRLLVSLRRFTAVASCGGQPLRELLMDPATNALPPRCDDPAGLSRGWFFGPIRAGAE